MVIAIPVRKISSPRDVVRPSGAALNEIDVMPELGYGTVFPLPESSWRFE